MTAATKTTIGLTSVKMLPMSDRGELMMLEMDERHAQRLHRVVLPRDAALGEDADGALGRAELRIGGVPAAMEGGLHVALPGDDELGHVLGTFEKRGQPEVVLAAVVDDAGGHVHVSGLGVRHGNDPGFDAE